MEVDGTPCLLRKVVFPKTMLDYLSTSALVRQKVPFPASAFDLFLPCADSDRIPRPHGFIPAFVRTDLTSTESKGSK